MGPQTPKSIPGPLKDLRIPSDRQFSGISAGGRTKAIGTFSRTAVSRIVPAADLGPMGRSPTLNPEFEVAQANRVAADSAPKEQALRTRLAEWIQGQREILS
jgi:hypothetical protein